MVMHRKLTGTVTNLMIMRTLKIITLVSYLFINGLGPHGIPNFAGIPLCLLSFLNDLLTQTFFNISWGLGILGLLSVFCLITIAFSRQFKDRFLLIYSLLVLISIEVFLSDILHHQKLIFWFVFPLLLFMACSILLIIKSFKGKKS